ncbi:MAG: hypothetical protein IKU62_06225 [Ruminiclostridium sp.]|nr:hypothetical protein [Ruminiclostridium sp.]
MADYNAHTYYGKKCLEYLSPEVRGKLVTDHTAFQLGLYGPDPLEFSGLGYWKVKKYHADWRREVLPFVTESIQSQDPTARSYAAGCLLHFVLDEKLHRAMKPWVKEGSSHYRLELALDSLVLQEQKIPLMPRLCVAHQDSIHHVFPGISPSLYHKGIWVMSKVVDWFRWRGEGLYRKVTSKEWDQAWYLLKLLEDHVPQGAKTLEELFSQK